MGLLEKIEKDRIKVEQYKNRWFASQYNSLEKELDSMIRQFFDSTGQMPKVITVSKEKHYLMHLETNAFAKSVDKPEREYNPEARYLFMNSVIVEKIKEV